MIKFIKILIILFLSQFAFTQVVNADVIKKFQGSKELPIELNLILDCLQNTENIATLKSVQEKITPTLLNIDSFARVLSKEDLFLIGKIEVYKSLLKPDGSIGKAIIDAQTIKLFDNALKNATDPFIVWLLRALRQDTENLITNPLYKDYLLQKNAGKIERNDLKKIDKKVSLLFRWVSKINSESSDFQEILKNELYPVLIETLKNIEESFFLLASQSNMSPFPGLITSIDEFKFISQKEIKISKPESLKDKSIEDILSPLIDDNLASEAILPEPSKEDWLNEYNTPQNLKNLPKPDDDANWLQDF